MAVLEKIRVKLGVLITVLIAVALLSFIIDPTTLETTFRFFSSEYDVGKIDGRKIRYEDFQKQIEYYTGIYELTSGGRTPDEQTQETINETAWQSLISDIYVIPQMRKAGIRVGEEELIDMSQGREISPVISSNQVFMDEKGEFSRERLLDFIHEIPSDESGNLASYWNFLQQSMTSQQYITKYTSLIEQSNIITPVELRRQIDENNTTSNVEFVLVPFGFQNDTTIKVSDKEIENYYKKHKENYRQNASRDVEFVAFEVVPSEKDIEDAKARIERLYPEFSTTSGLKTFLARNSDTPLRDYYYKEGELASSLPEVDEFAFGKNPTVLPVFSKGNIFYAARVNDVKSMPDSVYVQHILLAPGSEALADSLLNVINNRGDFSELAAQYSLDTNPNVEKPGDLGWLTQTYMLPGFESLMSASVGKAVILNTNYGLHIARVTERTELNKKVQIALLSVEAVSSKETFQTYYAQANDLVTGCDGKIENFDRITKEKSLPVVPVNNLAEGAKSLSRYQNTKEITRWVYEAEKGDVSPIITVDNDIFFVVALKDIKEEGYAPLGNVSASIRFNLMNEKRAEKIKGEVSADIEGMTDISAVAEVLGQKVSTKEAVSFGSMSSRATEPVFLGAAAGADLNEIAGPVAGNMGVYVLKVNGRETGAFYTEEDAKIRANQVASYQINSIPNIFTEMAKVVDHRARFF